MLIVFGSLNMDISARVGQLPQGGETVITDTYQFFSGGKGGNQAFAAARFGTKIAMVGKVGEDPFGDILFDTLKKEGVICSGIARSDLPTGCAFIARDTRGENQIIVMAGANGDVVAAQVPDEILKEGSYLLLQLEVPLGEMEKLIIRAKEKGVKIILNLAPAADVPLWVLTQLDYLIVNEHEAKQIADKLHIRDADNIFAIAKGLAQSAELTCIVTLGGQGSLAVGKTGEALQIDAYPIPQAEIVDTTGAGDCYCGTLAAALHEKIPLPEAMQLATVAGALACKQVGAQSSFPYSSDVWQLAETLPLPKTIAIA